MGGVVFNMVAGRMLDAGTGYGPVFAAVSTFHVLAFLLILLTIRRVKPIQGRPAQISPQGAYS